MSGRVGSITTEIIANGLVFNMDAANRASYIPNTTTAFNTTDLSQSGSLENDVVFISSPTPSFEFDGTDTYINIGNGISFEYTDAFSFSTWVKPLAKSGVKYLYSKYIGGKGILIYLNSSSSSGINTLHFNLYNTVSGTPSSRKWITTNVSGLLSVNDWANIIVTYDGSGLGSGISFYKNGIAQTVSVTYDNLQNNSIVNTEDAYLSSYNGASSFYSGLTSNFHIYNKALSSSEVLHNYNALKGRFGLS